MIEDVSFEILNRCLNCCLHCSSCSSIKGTDIFSLDKIKDIVKQLTEIRVKRICLSGGEPFLHSDLIEIVKYISERNILCDIYSSGVTMTNGLINSISIETFRLLKDVGLHRVMFNMQAMDEEIYDNIMGTGGNQNFLLRSIENAIACEIEVEIHFVPMKQNICQIEKILNYANQVGICQISFLKLVNHGNAKSNNLELSINDDTTLRKKLADLSSTNKKIRIGIPLTYGKIIYDCHALIKKIYIKYDGSLYGCEAFKHIAFEGVAVPNVYSESISTIITCSDYFQKSSELLCEYRNGNNNCPVQNYINKGEK